MSIFASCGYVCGAGKRLYDTKDKSKCINPQNHPAFYQLLSVLFGSVSGIK